MITLWKKPGLAVRLRKVRGTESLIEVGVQLSPSSHQGKIDEFLLLSAAL
jgi:hypothetical protein